MRRVVCVGGENRGGPALFPPPPLVYVPPLEFFAFLMIHICLIPQGNTVFQAKAENARNRGWDQLRCRLLHNRVNTCQQGYAVMFRYLLPVAVCFAVLLNSHTNADDFRSKALEELDDIDLRMAKADRIAKIGQRIDWQEHSLSSLNDIRERVMLTSVRPEMLVQS